MDATDRRWVDIFVESDRPPPPAGAKRLIGGSTRSTSGGDR